jgi:hypothetical protein
VLRDELNSRCLIGVDGREMSVVRLEDLGENVFDLEKEFKSAQYLRHYIGLWSSFDVRTARVATERQAQSLTRHMGSQSGFNVRTAHFAAERPARSLTRYTGSQSGFDLQLDRFTAERPAQSLTRYTARGLASSSVLFALPLRD